jgi:uncharacterized protein YuzE
MENTVQILGIGDDQQLYTRININEPWTKSPDVSGRVIAVTIMQDGTILGVGTDYKLYTRTNLDSPWWVKAPDNGLVIGVTIMHDGTILGVGTDYKLYTRLDLNSSWIKAPDNGLVIGVTIMQDGTILGVGKDYKLYTRLGLNSSWVKAPDNGLVIGVTIMQDGTILGVGTDYKLYTRLDLNSSWVKAPDNGLVIGVTMYAPPTSPPLPNPQIHLLKSLDFSDQVKTIKFKKNGYPLDYHSCYSYRLMHLQAMLRLPDFEGKRYYMGTYSQSVASDGSEGGMVFVGEWDGKSEFGNVTWCDVFNNNHRGGGFNHPGDLRLLDNVVVIAGQNWDNTDYPFCKKLHRGNGGQFVLFYDVSKPDSPYYMGKLNSCWKDNVEYKIQGEIDEVSISKSGDYYYLSFNEIKCKSKSINPDARWELIEGNFWIKAPDNGLVIGVTIMQDGTILGVGTDYKLYTRLDLNSSWVKAPDNGLVISVTIMQDGTILGVGTDYKLYTRLDLNSSWVKAPDNGLVIGVTIMQDGTILGVGTDYKLYTRLDLNSSWVKAPDNGLVIGVTIMQDGTILGVGKDYKLYTRADLNSSWIKAPDNGLVIGVTIMQDGTILGVGKDYKLYTRLGLNSEIYCDPAYFNFKGNLYYGGSSQTFDSASFNKFEFVPGGNILRENTDQAKRDTLETVSLPKTSLSGSSTSALSTFSSGESVIVRAEVESDDYIIIEEIENS